MLLIDLGNIMVFLLAIYYFYKFFFSNQKAPGRREKKIMHREFMNLSEIKATILITIVGLNVAAIFIEQNEKVLTVCLSIIVLLLYIIVLLYCDRNDTDK